MSNLFKLNLQLFAANVQTTTLADDGNSLAAELKETYDRKLIENAKPELVHGQFGVKKPIPKGGGKIITFRKYDPLPSLHDAPLVEGVTPDGQKLNVEEITATIAQYGGYITLSDMIHMVTVDNNVAEASDMLGSQAGLTLDAVIREKLLEGTNAIYGANKVAGRALLIGGNATLANNHYFDLLTIQTAVNLFERNNIKPLEGGNYVCICHPDALFDLKQDESWQDWNRYTTPEAMFNGEVGKIDKVRFVTSSQAKVFSVPDLCDSKRTAEWASDALDVITIDEAITAGTTKAALDAWLKERFDAGEECAIWMDGKKLKLLCDSVGDGTGTWTSPVVAGTATNAKLNLRSGEGAKVDGSVDKTIYLEGAGFEGRTVYANLFIGKGAYGITEIEGGELEIIVKQLGAGEDALNQRSTVGWKATQTAEVLVNTALLRVETTSRKDDLTEN